jgi:hypothetical protein
MKSSTPTEPAAQKNQADTEDQLVIKTSGEVLGYRTNLLLNQRNQRPPTDLPICKGRYCINS